MKRIILHIGIPKTGSTALQCYLKNNKFFLEAQRIGYYVPVQSYKPWGRGPSNGDFLLAQTLLKLGEPADKDKLRWLKNHPSMDQIRTWLLDSNILSAGSDLEAFSEYSNKYETLILSEEMIWHYEVYYPDFWSTMRDIIRECCGTDAVIDVVVYLRRQDKMLLSRWKETLIAATPNPWSFSECLEGFEKIGYLNYYASMRRIEEAFGKEHIIIRDFERNKLVGSNIITDFISACDLNITCDDAGNKEINESISIEAAYGMEHINKIHILQGRTGNRGHYYKSSKWFTKKFRSRGNQVQSREERAALLDRYNKDNKALSERYLNGEALFSEIVEDGVVVKKSAIRDRITAMLITVYARREQPTFTRITRMINKVRNGIRRK